MDFIRNHPKKIILVALCLYGSAFSGLWTPPGLEWVPTYREVFGEKTAGSGITPMP